MATATKTTTVQQKKPTPPPPPPQASKSVNIGSTPLITAAAAQKGNTGPSPVSPNPLAIKQPTSAPAPSAGLTQAQVQKMIDAARPSSYQTIKLLPYQYAREKDKTGWTQINDGPGSGHQLPGYHYEKIVPVYSTPQKTVPAPAPAQPQKPAPIDQRFVPKDPIPLVTKKPAATTPTTQTPATTNKPATTPTAQTSTTINKPAAIPSTPTGTQTSPSGNTIQSIVGGSMPPVQSTMLALPFTSSTMLSGNATGFSRARSSARKAGLTTKGTSRLKINRAGPNAASSGLNIGM